MTQQEEILRHLQTHKRPLTSKAAFEKFGCTRLAGVIYNLKKKGYAIESVYEVVKTRYGGKIEIAGYKIGSDRTDTEVN